MKKLFRLANWAVGLAAFALLYAAQQTADFRCVLAGGGLLGVMVLLNWLNDRHLRKMNVRTPAVTVEAEVVSHRMAQERVGNKYITRYYISFRPVDGSPNLEFEVSQLDYEDFDAGETGPLRYRGWEFLSFGVKDKSGFEPMAPLAEEYEPRPEPKSAIQRAGEQIASLWARLTTRFARRDSPAQENADGILTHELDE